MPDFPATILAAATPERNTFARNCVANFPLLFLQVKSPLITSA